VGIAVVTPRKPAPTPRARKKPLGSVSRAASSGDGLLAVRAELTRRLDDPNLADKDVAGIVRALLAVEARIAAQSVTKEAGLDELAARRNARRSG
jgi:hypothetical protein